MPKDTAFASENEILRSVAGTGIAVTYDVHALEQMRKRGIWRQDVQRALETGHIVGIEIAHGNEERWRIAGENVDGFPLIVIIKAIKSETAVAYVVTAFEPE